MSKPSPEIGVDFQQRMDAIKSVPKGHEKWHKKLRKTVQLLIGLIGCEFVGWIFTLIPFLWELAPAEAAVDGAADTGIVLRVLFLAYQAHKWSKVHRNDPLLRVSN
ncbi:MAG: hypothetical protein ACHQTE_02480 [Candidatus Saccharimonadales bacterium]